jgi:hypothetical protein
MVLATALGLVACGAGCASHSALAVEDRGYLERAWAGREKDQFLKLSFYVTPFFGDSTKRLLTALPPDEVRLLQSPGGQTISPGKVERILPAGTPVQIEKVEFPTSYVIPGRILYTPRTLPWIYLRVPGESGPPLILVLRPQLRSRAEAQSELDRYLTEVDPAPLLSTYSSSVREGIRRKDALEDMPADALERAWGYPERKQVRFTEDSREEEWIYPGARRRAVLQDDRVVRLDQPSQRP